jgi:hypothetical protein
MRIVHAWAQYSSLVAGVTHPSKGNYLHIYIKKCITIINTRYVW